MPTPPPRPIVYAAAALLAAGVLGVIAALTELTPASKQWLFEQTKKADAKMSSVKSGKTKMPTDAQIHHTVNSSGVPVTVISLIVAAILAFVAYSLTKGKYWTRWAIVGIFVVLTFFAGTPGGGLTGLLGVASDAPVYFKAFAFLSSLAMIVAIMATNMRPSIAYLAANRPPKRPRAGGGGGLFGPRPARPTTTSTTTSKSTASRAATKPATTRSAAAGRQGTNRDASTQRSKPRVDVTAPDVKARPRGKSRRTSDDKTS